MRVGSRFRVKLVRQAALADCGLACVAMAAAAYGCEISLAELTKRFPPSLRGISVRQIVRVADALGLRATAVMFDPNRIDGLTVPAILHWRGNHFTLLAKRTKATVTILDPMWGRRRYRTAELQEYATGVAVEVEPTEELVIGRVGVRDTSLRHILAELKLVRLDIAKVVATALYLEAVVVMVPLLLAHLINVLAAGRNQTPQADIIAVALGVGTIAIWGLRAIRSMGMLHLSSTIKRSFLSKLIPKLLSKPFTFFKQRSVADLVYRLNGAEQFRNTISEEFVGVIVDAIMTMAILAAIAYFNVTAGAVSLVAIVMIGGGRWYFAQADVVRFDDIIHLRGAEAVFVQETLRAASAIKLFAREDERAQLWAQRVGRTLSKETEHSKRVLATAIVPAALADLIVVATIIREIVGMGSAVLNVGTVFGIYIYQKLAFERCLAVASRASQYNILKLYLNRMSDVLDDGDAQGASSQTASDSLEWPSDGVVLEAEQVSFRFSAESDFVLKDLSFRVNAGEFIGIYGKSGAGKTTLVEILLGIREAERGLVRWCGVASHRIAHRSLRGVTGAVMQDDVIFMGTIAENIALFAPTPDAAEIERAATMALLADEVHAMPLQYATEVGENGSGLSGGQRQRLLLARALYGEPRMLIIDEGTNEIDPDTERSIYEHLTRLGVSLLVIAHRWETLRLADRTLVLEDGRLQEMAGAKQLRPAKARECG